MNKKVYKTLEYNKILTMLSSYAACDETKKRCLSLEPITDLYEIRHLQTTTADALSRLYKDSGVSFVGIHNVHASLKRLDIGGALNTTELLRICSLLEVAKRVKAYGRSAMDNEKRILFPVCLQGLNRFLHSAMRLRGAFYLRKRLPMMRVLSFLR